MENRKGDCTPGARCSLGSAGFALPFLLAAALAAMCAGGCAAPGEPLERKALVPAAVTDLAAAQQGDSVILTFTMPKVSVEHRELKAPPTVEIYRSFSPLEPSVPTVPPSTALPAPEMPVLYVTIPPATVDRYSDRGFVRYTDPLKPEDFAQHSAWIAHYVVRTQTTGKKTSADSNRADFPIFSAPDPIDDLKAEVTRSGVVLTWTPPQKTLGGTAPLLSGYRVYRAEEAAAAARKANSNAFGSAPATSENRADTGSRPLFLQIGESEAPAFRDTQAGFGKSYIYSVRSVSPHAGQTLESDDSNPVPVTPEDVFPASAPEGLVVVLVPAQTDSPASLDLSWAISPETDIAGYNVYRSEQTGVAGQRLNGELLLTPAFRDMNALAGHRYFYTVTAVDRSGNESKASAAVSSGVPAESSPAS